MTNKLDINNCRKCGAKNPESNQYCASCGAILQVSTAMIAAQPKSAFLQYHRFQNRWLIISIFVLLGVWVISALATLVFSALFLNISVESMTFGETEMTTSAIPILFHGLGILSVSFFLAGFFISRIARDTKIVETVVSAIIVSIFIGVSGTIISADFLIASLLLGLPGAVAVGLGARMGGKKFERKQC